MHHKLTISVDDEVYQGLHKIIGRGKISQFIEQLIRPYVLKTNLENAYLEMRNDRHREAEAEAWSENFIGEVSDHGER
jgi:predicted CopG family antitoxin